MTRSRAALLLSAVMAVAALVVNAQKAAPARGPAAPPGSAVVTRVVDGDTIRVRMADGGGSEAVRLIGVDTPESVKPRTPVECFAKEAAAHTAELVPPGTAVRLVRDVEARDRYGRLLAYVYRAEDGLFVNLALAQDGFAAPLTIAPNVAHSEAFAAAAGRARQAQRGLWARCGGPHESSARARPPPTAG
ncbi:MAG TPA: thermonuclease family protein [Acidimicrobiales bacterium]|jgi:micrococcal nuclease|nr:thermonuclease family protein [Acidimicrobiales bacterium]